jgi:hypothetical protein
MTKPRLTGLHQGNQSLAHHIGIDRVPEFRVHIPHSHVIEGQVVAHGFAHGPLFRIHIIQHKIHQANDQQQVQRPVDNGRKQIGDKGPAPFGHRSKQVFVLHVHPCPFFQLGDHPQNLIQVSGIGDDLIRKHQAQEKERQHDDDQRKKNDAYGNGYLFPFFHLRKIIERALEQHVENQAADKGRQIAQ